MLPEKVRSFINKNTSFSDVEGEMPYPYMDINNVKYACDLAYDEGVKDTTILKLFKSVEKDGLPKMKEGWDHSNPCLCFCPGDNDRVSGFLVAYYLKIKSSIVDGSYWVYSHNGGFIFLNVTHYIELCDPNEFEDNIGK